MKRMVVAAPWIFTIIWSSGFVVAKYAFADADAIFFLAIRLILATIILLVIGVALGQSFKLSRRDLRASLLIGIALHGLYLGGVWYAIELGAPAGISSVITSMQPIIVSILAVRLLGEALTRRQIGGLICGLLGVILVVLPKLAKADGFSGESLTFLVIALAGSTVATLLQKKIGHSIPLIAGTTYQFAIAAAVMLLISIARSRTHFELTHNSLWAMAWAVLVTSIAAVLLLLWLLNQGSAAKVSSLLYLVPPLAVLQAYLFFDETITLLGALGIAMTALGVALVIRS